MISLIFDLCFLSKKFNWLEFHHRNRMPYFFFFFLLCELYIFCCCFILNRWCCRDFYFKNKFVLYVFHDAIKFLESLEYFCVLFCLDTKCTMKEYETKNQMIFSWSFFHFFSVWNDICLNLYMEKNEQRKKNKSINCIQLNCLY